MDFPTMFAILAASAGIGAFFAIVATLVTFDNRSRGRGATNPWALVALTVVLVLICAVCGGLST